MLFLPQQDQGRFLTVIHTQYQIDLEYPESHVDLMVQFLIDIMEPQQCLSLQEPKFKYKLLELLECNYEYI